MLTAFASPLSSRRAVRADVAPITRAGRLLTVFWTICSVLSLSAFTSVVSARA